MQKAANNPVQAMAMRFVILSHSMDGALAKAALSRNIEISRSAFPRAVQPSDYDIARI